MTEKCQFNPETEEQHNLVEAKKPTETEKEPTFDALVVFGFGIKSDLDLEKRGQDTTGLVKGGYQPWRLPLGAKLRTVAAAEVYLTGSVGDVIFTGGPVKVREGVPESEAELMKEYFLHILEKRKREEIRHGGMNQDDIEKELHQYLSDAASHVRLEDKATNTIENFSNTINHINAESYSNIGLLSSQFHLARIMNLAKRHGIEGVGVSAEEEVLKKRRHYQKIVNRYFSEEGNKQFREEVLSDFQDIEAIKQVETKFGPGYGSFMGDHENKTTKKLGTSFEDYQKGERRWNRGVDEIPEYWMQGLQYIENPEILINILRAQDGVQGVLKEKYGLNVDEASIEDIKNALGETERIMPPEEWGNK